MRKLARTGLLLVVAWLVTGCAGQRPRVPEPFQSPLGVPAAQQRIYLPAVHQPVRRLGMAGCPQHPESIAQFGMSWCYSWSADPGILPGIETVPMIWDETHIHDELGGSSRYVMLWNEPDWPTQANISPTVAAGLLFELETTYPQAQWVAPVTTRFGLTWWRDFLAAYEQLTGRRPRFAALAAHANMPADQAISWVTWWVVEAQRLAVPEVWVTEIAQWSAEDAHIFTAWAMSQPSITRYAPFVSIYDCSDLRWWDCARDGDPSLLNANGSLTERGQWYAQPETPW